MRKRKRIEQQKTPFEKNETTIKKKRKIVFVEEDDERESLWL